MLRFKHRLHSWISPFNYLGVADDLDVIKCNKNIPVNVMEFQTFRETIGKFTQWENHNCIVIIKEPGKKFKLCVYILKRIDFLFLKTQHFFVTVTTTCIISDKGDKFSA